MVVQTGLTTIAQGSLVATGSQSAKYARYARAPGTCFYFVSLGDAWPQWVLSLGVFCILVVAFASGTPSPFSSLLLVHKLPGALGLTPATRGGSYKHLSAAYICIFGHMLGTHLLAGILFALPLVGFLSAGAVSLKNGGQRLVTGWPSPASLLVSSEERWAAARHRMAGASLFTATCGRFRWRGLLGASCFGLTGLGQLQNGRR